MDAALDCQDSKRVIMCINSPGGDVDGCFEVSRELRNLATNHNKPLIAYVDGMAASAAYALASAADAIVLPPSAFVGSIGIIETLCDQSANDAMNGLRFVMVTSGSRKADGNPHVPISKDSTNALQGHVNALAELFYALVEENRGIEASTLRGFQASMFLGQRAIDVRLADNVVTLNELLASFANNENNTLKPEAKAAMPQYLDAVKDHATTYAKMLVDGDDNEKKVARRRLKALEEGEPDEGAPPEKKKDAKAEDEGEDKKASAKASKAEGEDEDKKAKAAKAEDEDESEDKKAKAASAEDEDEGKKMKASSDLFEVIKEFHALKASMAAKEEAEARSNLLATRPDFDDKTKAMMSKWPLSQVAAAVETFPRIPLNKAAASAVIGTRGNTQVDVNHTFAHPDESDFIAKSMGLKPSANLGTHNDRNHLVLGPMTKEQAAKRLIELAKENN